MKYKTELEISYPQAIWMREYFITVKTLTGRVINIRSEGQERMEFVCVFLLSKVSQTDQVQQQNVSYIVLTNSKLHYGCITYHYI